MSRLSPEEIIDQISGACSGTWLRNYVKSKLRTDPLYEAVVAEMAPVPGPLLDVGCGVGLLGCYLRLCGWEGRVTGVDFDKRKIKQGRELAERLELDGLQLATGNAEDLLQEQGGSVAILDVLQYLTEDNQKRLLEKTLQGVSTDGKIIIRSGIFEDSRRFRVTKLGDWVGKLTFWMKERPVHYPTQEFFHEVFARNGFGCEITPLWGNTPFNNYLIVGRNQNFEGSNA